LLTVDFLLAITFPGAVLEHNGELEDRTVTWDLDDLEDESEGLFAQSRIGGGFPWAIVGGVLLALLVAGAVVWRIRDARPRPVPVPSSTPVVEQVTSADAE
jgi:hypothetical protein